MALRGHVFDKQLFSSDCYALVTDTFLNENSGIIKGCKLTNTASSIYIDEGYFVIKGRPIQEEGGTTIEIEPGSANNIYCKLVCEIDMSQTNTTTSLNQVSYKVIEDTTDYPKLTQEDITDGGTIYQFEFAKFKRTLNGIEDFVDTRSFLNFNSIYEEIKKEIKKIEEGSIFVTNEQFNKTKNYSTEEQIIGEWIDGKPLYRKVLYIGTLPNNETKNIAHGISNIGLITKIEGIAYSGVNYLPLPLADTAGYPIRVHSNVNNIVVFTTYDYSSFVSYITLEYTKTTA